MPLRLKWHACAATSVGWQEGARSEIEGSKGSVVAQRPIHTGDPVLPHRTGVSTPPFSRGRQVRGLRLYAEGTPGLLAVLPLHGRRQAIGNDVQDDSSPTAPINHERYTSSRAHA